MMMSRVSRTRGPTAVIPGQRRLSHLLVFPRQGRPLCLSLLPPSTHRLRMILPRRSKRWFSSKSAQFLIRRPILRRKRLASGSWKLGSKSSSCKGTSSRAGFRSLALRFPAPIPNCRSWPKRSPLSNKSWPRSAARSPGCRGKCAPLCHGYADGSLQSDIHSDCLTVREVGGPVGQTAASE